MNYKIKKLLLLLIVGFLAYTFIPFTVQLLFIKIIPTLDTVFISLGITMWFFIVLHIILSALASFTKLPIKKYIIILFIIYNVVLTIPGNDCDKYLKGGVYQNAIMPSRTCDCFGIKKVSTSKTQCLGTITNCKTLQHNDEGLFKLTETECK